MRSIFILILIFLSQALAAQFPAQDESLQHIIRSLNEKNIDYELRPLLQDHGGFGHSVHVHIPAGRSLDYNAGTFVLAVPADSLFAAETALAFINAVRNEQERVFSNDILVAFLGNEKSLLDNPLFSNAGLRDLISQSDIPGSWALCYLDLGQAPVRLEITHGAGDYIAPLELLKPLPALFRSHGAPMKLEVRYNELFKMGLVKGSQELALLWQDEIYGLVFNPGSGSSLRDTGEAITAQTLAGILLDYEAALELPIENPGQNYFIFSMAGWFLFISEITALVSLIVFAAILLLRLLYLSAARRTALISRIRLFLRRGWVFFILLPGMVLIFRGTGIFYGFLHQILHLPAPKTDFWGSILIILLAAWLLYLFFHLLSFLNFPRKAQLYGISAIIIIGIGVLASAVLDFSYSAIFLWALLFAYIGGVSKKPALIILSAALIPARALRAFINIMESGGFPLDLFIVPGNTRGWIMSFQIAVLLLPIMLLIKRGMIINKTTMKDIFRITPFIARIIMPVVLICAMILRLTYFFHVPEESRYYVLSSFTEIPSDNRYGNNDQGLSISHSQTVFQESLIVNLRIQSVSRPVVFNLFLESENNDIPLVYSSPVPTERLDNNVIRFILGENPPNPLRLEIVLRNDFRGTFRTEAVYLPDEFSD